MKGCRRPLEMRERKSVWEIGRYFFWEESLWESKQVETRDILRGVLGGWRGVFGLTAGDILRGFLSLVGKFFKGRGQTGCGGFSGRGGVTEHFFRRDSLRQGKEWGEAEEGCIVNFSVRSP